MEDIVVRGVAMRAWKHGPRTMREVFEIGRGHGDATFLVHEDDRASFEAFARATLKVAAALQEAGVAKGDRVAIAMRNLPEFPVALFATWLVGGIATLVNAWGTGPEIAYMLADSGSRIAFVDGERAIRIAPHLDALPDLQRLIVTRHDGPLDDARTTAFDAIVGPVSSWHALPEGRLPDVALDPDDDATIFYTSGTTGKPKGALGTHRNLTTTTIAFGYSTQRAFLRRGQAIPDPAARKTPRVTLVTVPYFHVTGCQVSLCAGLYNGIRLVTMHRWDVIEAMRLIERERVTQAGGVPTIAFQILEHPDRDRYDLSSLESIAYGGAPAAADLVRRLVAAFPKARPSTGWGMTETSATFTHHAAEEYETHPESCGVPLPVCDAKVTDDDGRALPNGALGELWATGPNIVKGYWNRPEATAATFVDGWVRTGDIARIDDEGFIAIVDRKKDMLIRGGENIYCIEVEDALYRHPDVVDAAVIGRAHPALGEEPVAIVTVKPGATVDESTLRAFVASQLAAFKVPVAITFTHDPLPRNANGKILKRELKSIHEKGRTP